MFRLSSIFPGKVGLTQFLNLYVCKKLSKMPKRKVQTSITNFSEKTESSQIAKKKKTEEYREKTESSKNVSVPKSKEKDSKMTKKPFNKTDTDFSVIDFCCDKKSADGRAWNFKISSWNVVSLNSVTKKNGMDFIKHELPDIMCFQETKCNEAKVPEAAKLKDYHRYFVSGIINYYYTGENSGYAGVALYSKIKPLKVNFGIGHKEYDNEGRVITAEYEKFFLVTAYVPNAGRGLVTLPKRMKWDPLFREYLKKLNSEKPVILGGDLNVAHQEIDLKNPAGNTRTAGFTEEERDGFTALLNEGFIDTFRKLYPDKAGAYTYWNYIGNARSRNAGWRLDYFVVSERLMSAVCDSVIRSEVYGSDHCPITLFLCL